MGFSRFFWKKEAIKTIGNNNETWYNESDIKKVIKFSYVATQRKTLAELSFYFQWNNDYIQSLHLTFQQAREFYISEDEFFLILSKNSQFIKKYENWSNKHRKIQEKEIVEKKFH